MIQSRNCALAACASQFPYKDECGLVASGCCARDMLVVLKRCAPDGVDFPMDLRLSGNPFVNALVEQGFARVSHGRRQLTHFLTQQTAEPAQ